MRLSGYAHPEWGYFAPTPSFLRTVRLVLISTVTGAVAGAAVVVSLMSQPAAEHSVMVEPSVTASSPTLNADQPTLMSTSTEAPARSGPAAATASAQSSLASDLQAAPISSSVSLPSTNASPRAGGLAEIPKQAANTADQGRVRDAQQRRKIAKIVVGRREDFETDRWPDVYRGYYDYDARAGGMFGSPPYAPYDRRW